MSQALPERSNLEFLRKLAKDRLRVLRVDRPTATLAEAQLLVARDHGLPSWRQLKAHVDARMAAAAVDAAQVNRDYEDPFVAALPEHRRTHKVVQWKPLMDAAYAGDTARARRLLDAGADPNIVSTTPQRYRPLHRAIERKKTAPKHDGHEAVVKLLLERGADPALRGCFLRLTALQLAGMEGEAQFVKPLRKHFNGLDIFHAAVVCDDNRVSRLLDADPALVKARDENGLVALHYCAASGLFQLGVEYQDAQITIAKALISRGADPNAAHLAEEKWPIPPLYYAAGYHDNPALVEVLLEAGADPCDNEGIYHASDEGHEGSLAVFERHVDPKKLAIECTGALAAQFSWGRTRGAQWLLAHGADPNYLRPESGESALHMAARTGRSDKVVRLLLDHGADPTRKNAAGASACLIASRAKAWRVLAVLEDALKSRSAAGRAKTNKRRDSSVRTSAGRRKNRHKR